MLFYWSILVLFWSFFFILIITFCTNRLTSLRSVNLHLLANITFLYIFYCLLLVSFPPLMYPPFILFLTVGIYICAAIRHILQSNHKSNIYVKVQRQFRLVNVFAIWVWEACLLCVDVIYILKMI